MKATIVFVILLAFVGGFLLTSNKESSIVGATSLSSDLADSTNKDLKAIYFAGGCFWGTEHFFQQVRGVVKTEVGYANGNVDKPSYEQVTTGKTGYAETVKVVYDPTVVHLDLLIDLFLKTIDPTSINKQGNDIGTQYRSGIYYVDPSEQSLIDSKLQDLAKGFNTSIVVESKPLTNFYIAEKYHQKYLDKNPGGYCHIGPELFEMAKKANKK